MTLELAASSGYLLVALETALLRMLVEDGAEGLHERRLEVGQSDGGGPIGKADSDDFSSSNWLVGLFGCLRAAEHPSAAPGPNSTLSSFDVQSRHERRKGAAPPPQITRLPTRGDMTSFQRQA